MLGPNQVQGDGFGRRGRFGWDGPVGYPESLESFLMAGKSRPAPENKVLQGIQAGQALVASRRETQFALRDERVAKGPQWAIVEILEEPLGLTSGKAFPCARGPLPVFFFSPGIFGR